MATTPENADEKLSQTLDKFSGDGWETVTQESQFWKPDEIGDHIQGTLVEEREGQYGPLFVLTDEDGEEQIIGDYTALTDELRDLVDEQPEIAIIYTGEDTSENGPYKTFRVQKKKSEETPSTS